MSVHEDEKEEERRELVSSSSKSLSINTILLQEANLKMESYFDSD